MPINTTQPGSPGWWLQRQAKALIDQRPRYEKLWRYHSGDADLPEGAEGCRAAYRAFQRKARLNYANLIGSALTDRLGVTGFRTGADDDENGDIEARDIWNANDLRVGSADLHTFVAAMSRAYTIVGGPTSETSGLPRITVEDPRQVITAQDSADPRITRAGLKMFTDEWTGRDMAYVYLPGRERGTVHVAASRTDAAATSGMFEAGSWEWLSRRGGEAGEKLPTPGVPIHRFLNKDGWGEFEPHMDLLDQINDIALNLMILAKMQAHRQMAVKNVPFEDEDGNEIDYSAIFTPGPGSLWLLPEGAEMWESGVTDLQGHILNGKDKVQQLAAVSKTPLYFISPDAANGSAEGASTMREAVTFKAEDRQNRLSSPYKRMMADAFRIKGDERRANLLAMEPIWSPAERFSLIERSQASSQAQDVPWRTRMRKIWQFTPDEIAEMEGERLADALVAGVSGFEAAPDANPA